jgi:DNA-binding winged helix-turn-helix (wHTH) protein
MVAVPGNYQFGQFELDVGAAELRRDGRQIRLQPQPFTLLTLLVRRSGDVVTRQEIREALWPDGTFVDFDQAMNFAIKQVRDALGDSAEKPLYVQTIPKRGYRFIAPVAAPASPSTAAAAQALLAGGSSNTLRLQKAVWANIVEMRLAQQRQRRLTLTAIGVGVVVLTLLLGFWMATR